MCCISHPFLASIAVSVPPPSARGEVCSDEEVLSGRSAKAVLDRFGPARLVEWVKQQSRSRILLTDTTMRDAHQSLLATRVRTIDLVEGAKIAHKVLEEAFSLEMWGSYCTSSHGRHCSPPLVVTAGGATFDVCMRFLDECPWERLRTVRKTCPNIMLQMLIRGANAVGYTSYPDNVVEEFVRLAAVNGMDVFRIFDCFNIVDSMARTSTPFPLLSSPLLTLTLTPQRVSIRAVLAANKVAEVCMCYTGNVLSSSIYNVDYYAALATEIQATGAHILGIKDMAGLLRPFEVEPLMTAIRKAVGESLPVHFHTHATSSCSLATCMEM